MLKLSSLVLLLIVGCSGQPTIRSDEVLTEKKGFKKVFVSPKESERIVFNIERIEPFNYCQISAEGSLYTIDHNKSDSLLVISNSLVNKIDTLNNTLGPFLSGYSFNIIIGNKLNADTSDLSMKIHIPYSIVVE